jgi:hypothetical protein
MSIPKMEFLICSSIVLSVLILTTEPTGMTLASGRIV